MDMANVVMDTEEAPEETPAAETTPEEDSVEAVATVETTPAAPGAPFHATVENADRHLGLRLSVGLLQVVMPGVGLVTDVEEDGAVARYNLEYPDKKIEQGCIVYAINGQLREQLPIHVLKNRVKVQLSCVNWTREVILVKGTKGLGLKLQQKGFVGAVSGILMGGSISKYNDDYPDTPIELDDIILRVNGKEGAFDLLLQELQNSPRVKLTILRIQDPRLVPVGKK